MKIELNGKPLVTGAATLEALLEEAGYGGATVATAVNGQFVAKGLRRGTVLGDGDRVEVLAPMQGG